MKLLPRLDFIVFTNGNSTFWFLKIYNSEVAARSFMWLKVGQESRAEALLYPYTENLDAR